MGLKPGTGHLEDPGGACLPLTPSSSFVTSSVTVQMEKSQHGAAHSVTVTIHLIIDGY